MSSLKADFDELIRRVEAGREFAHASFEPIFYLVFHPREMLEVKRLMPAWTPSWRNEGWQVEDVLDRRAHRRHSWQRRPAQGLARGGSEGPSVMGTDQRLARQRADRSGPTPVPPGGTAGGARGPDNRRSCW